MDCDTLDVSSPKYRFYMGEDLFIRVASGMFRTDRKRLNGGVLRLIREALLTKHDITFEDIFGNCAYSINTIAVRKSELRQSNYFDRNDCLRDLFFTEYFARADKIIGAQVESTEQILDAPLLNEMYISEFFTFDDVLDVLKKNRDIEFKFPEIDPVVTEDLDYLHPQVQYAELSHISAGVQHPFHVDFYYKCVACKQVIRSHVLLKKDKCMEAECGGKLVRQPTRDMVVNTYVSQVMHKNATLPVISLTPLPDGEFKAAMIVCRDGKNTKYFGFILAVKRRTYEESALVLPRKEHAVWEIVDTIDALHQERTGMHIQGLDYLKAAFILAAIGNFGGYASLNVMYAGRHGVGKTVVPLFYSHTLSHHSILQDSNGTSVPGMVGSSLLIDVNGQKVMVQEPGLLARYEFIIVDELYDQKEQFLKNLKTNLLSPQIIKNVAGVKITATKTATVCGTANIDTSLNSKYQSRFDELLLIYLSSPENYRNTSRIAEKVVASLPCCNDPGVLIRETIKKEYQVRGKNWIDGRDLPDIERFPLLFYIGSCDSDNSDKEYVAQDLCNVNFFRPSSELHEVLYSQDIRDYLQMCTLIEVHLSPGDHANIAALGNRLRSHNHIHSHDRFIMTLKRLLEYSAKANCRDYLTLGDFELVEELMLHTCNWVEPVDLVRTHHLRSGSDNACYTAAGTKDPVTTEVGSIEGDEVLPARVSTIFEYLGEKYDNMRLAEIDGPLKDRAVQVLTESLLTKFDIEQRFMAKQYVLDYLKKREPSVAVRKPIDVFEAVEVLDARPQKKQDAFGDVKYEETQQDLHDLIVDEFVKLKVVAKQALEKFAELNNIAMDAIDSHMGHLKKKGLVLDIGDSYRWVG